MKISTIRVKHIIYDVVWIDRRQEWNDSEGITFRPLSTWGNTYNFIVSNGKVRICNCENEKKSILFIFLICWKVNVILEW